MVTCAADQPLVRREDSELSEDTLMQLLEAATSHAAAEANLLNKETFAGSRGFVLRFNRDGARSLVANASHEFHFAAPFLNRARDPGANAFVLNVLIIPPASPRARSPP